MRLCGFLGHDCLLWKRAPRCRGRSQNAANSTRFLAPNPHQRAARPGMVAEGEELETNPLQANQRIPASSGVLDDVFGTHGPGQPVRNIAARSSCAEVRRFLRLINTDEVFGTHTWASCVVLPYSYSAVCTAFANRRVGSCDAAGRPLFTPRKSPRPASSPPRRARSSRESRKP